MGMRSEWSVVSIVDPADHYSSRFFANSDNKPIVLNSFPIMNCSGIQMFPIRNGGVQEQMMMVDDEHDDESVKRVDVVDFFSEKRSERLQSRDDDDVDVKRESSHGEAASVRRPREFDVVNTGLNLVIANNGRSKQSILDDGISVSAQGSDEKRRTKIELSQLQMELGRMTDENLRLKEMLTAVTSDYKALEFRIMSLMKQKETGHEHKIQNVGVVKSMEKRHGVNGLDEGRNFLEIGRGGSSAAERDEVLSHSVSDERTRSGSAQAAGKRPRGDNEELQSKERIELDDTKGEKRLSVGEGSPDPDTQFGTGAKPGTAKAGIDQQSAEATMRKARVSVRARSDAAMISDGCQWRKYGQKMAKGNPCPRAYYRCTMAVGCPVRKQIQRCAEDRTILVTTYEGNHNHPLPPAAIPMASATTTAATMLLSGSMSSSDGLMNPNFLARTMLPYSSSMATISASAPFPTVTLDLTHTAAGPQAQFSGPIPPQTLASLPFITNQILSQGLHNQSKFSELQVSQYPSLTDSMAAAITANPNLNAIITAAINNILTSGVNNNNNSSTTSTQRQ